jgi:hypothetical protein
MMVVMHQMLKENTLEKISYHKTERLTDQVVHGELTHRVVIPTFVPAPKHSNVKAIDVTGLSESDQTDLLDAWNDYQDYLENQRKTMFGFEDFIEHTRGERIAVKWRTFKPEGLDQFK